MPAGTVGIGHVLNREGKLKQFQNEAGIGAATGLKKQAAGKLSSLSEALS